jgi:group II intron reverse transcriptase/maturase
LGIPTVADRVVMTAVVLVLEPIFEADLQPEQYAYRPQRSALDAIRHVHSLLNTGYTEVVDADLSGYFDTSPHRELMKSVARRISDKAMLHLIKMWLEAPVEEVDERGNRRRSTPNRDRKRGCPQGAPISPLLSNLYMRRFVLGWKVLGHEQRLQARIVNYADDLVICCRGSADDGLAVMRQMMEQLRLTINEVKTHICRIPQESFDFLGYTFGRCYSTKMGRAYIGTRPSGKKIKQLCGTIHDLTARRWLWMEEEAQVRRLNEAMGGWANYFCLGAASPAYRRVTQHARKRLRQWLCKKHRMRSRRYTRYSDAQLHRDFGLINLEGRKRNFSCANA